jgi:DNA-binding LacI/PurR family transcriptional regulator
MSSIKDVARLANVSISTVSLAYNQPSRVSPQTSAAIFAAAKELDYAPSGHADARLKENAVVFVLSGVMEAHIQTIQGMRDTCQILGLNLIPMVFPPDRDAGLYAAIETAIRQRHVAGVIFAGEGIPILSRAAQESGIPVVFFMRHFSDPNAAEIQLNNKKIGADMAAHLITNGYASLAVIGGPADHLRIAGFAEALARAGRTIYDENGWMDAAVRVESCAEAYDFICGVVSTQSNLPDAIFCFTDMIALGALTALQVCGVRVPEDVALAGCEDIDISVLTTPQITSFRMPRYEQGVQAMMLLSRMMKGRPSERILLNCKLIERDSTRRRY